MNRFRTALVTMLFILACCCQQAFAQMSNSGDLYNGGSWYVRGDVYNTTTGKIVNNSNLYVADNVFNDGTTNYDGGTLHFVGVDVQWISGTTGFNTTNATFNNSAGVEIEKKLSVANLAMFSAGIVTAAIKAEPLEFRPSGGVVAPKGVRDASHVNGFVSQTAATGKFEYPVGDGKRYQKLDVNFTVNESGLLVGYMAADAGTAPFTKDGLVQTELKWYSTQEFWETSASGAVKGDVTLYYDSYKPVSIESIEQLSLANKVTAGWNNEGGTVIGTTSSGRIVTEGLSVWGHLAAGIYEPIMTIQVYPNPLVSGGILSIDRQARGTALAELYDLTGRKLAEYLLNQGANQLDTEPMAIGTYVLKITNQATSKTVSSRFVVK